MTELDVNSATGARQVGDYVRVLLEQGEPLDRALAQTRYVFTPPGPERVRPPGPISHTLPVPPADDVPVPNLVVQHVTGGHAGGLALVSGCYLCESGAARLAAAVADLAARTSDGTVRP